MPQNKDWKDNAQGPVFPEIDENHRNSSIFVKYGAYRPLRETARPGCARAVAGTVEKENPAEFFTAGSELVQYFFTNPQ